MNRRIGRIGAALTLLFLGCRGCEERVTDFLDQFAATFGNLVDTPRLDSTAPLVSLHVPDLGAGATVLTQSSSPLTATLGPSDGFFLVAVAEDSQGVEKVGFEGEAQVQCTQDGIGLIRHELIGGPSSVDDDGDGKGFTRRWIPTYVSRSQHACSAGWTLVSGTLWLRAVGQNFSGGIRKSAVATFTWP